MEYFVDLCAFIGLIVVLALAIFVFFLIVALGIGIVKAIKEFSYGVPNSDLKDLELEEVMHERGDSALEQFRKMLSEYDDKFGV